MYTVNLPTFSSALLSSSLVLACAYTLSHSSTTSQHLPLVLCCPNAPVVLRSMTTLHLSSTSRESVLPIWWSNARSWLSQPDVQASPFVRSTLNSYLYPHLLGYHHDALSVLERSIPWQYLTQLFATIPRNILSAQGLNILAGGGDTCRWRS
ncbi:hypothetical protein M405DRAFT_244556 [Rhizopogon salebrosus TDB-379]|nr:hypothetical protein M405DRAFT_244556 [Rhizopogon salebrosus TDB-379]